MRRLLFLGVGFLLAASAGAQMPPLRKGVSVQMPVTRNAVAVPDADLPDSLVVAVTYRGTVYLEVTTVTPAQLSEKLKAEFERRPGRRVYVKGDARTPYSAMAEVLDALRTARVDAPILLTDQRDSRDTGYVQPKGLEVFVGPPARGAERTATLKLGTGQASDTELKQHAQRDKPIVLQADGKAPFGDAVHAVDVCRGAGAKVFLAGQEK